MAWAEKIFAGDHWRGERGRLCQRIGLDFSWRRAFAGGEVAILDGAGKIELTGSLGDVMKESAHIAVSLVRRMADRYAIDKDFL